MMRLMPHTLHRTVHPQAPKVDDHQGAVNAGGAHEPTAPKLKG